MDIVTNQSVVTAWYKRKGVLVVLAVAGFAVLIALWLSRPDPKAYELSSTQLKSDTQFGHLSGSDIYAFNGLSFYKINTDTQAVTVLLSGRKLPTPSRIHWAGSQGILVNFKQSFYRSQVDEALQSMGLALNRDSQDYTWYLDFASGSLKLVSKLPIKADLAVFSADEQGFYYIPDYSNAGDFGHEAGAPDPTKTPLLFYNLATGQVETVSNDLAVRDVSYIGLCSSYRLCLIDRTAAGHKLLAVEQTGQTKSLVDARGRLFPTNNGDLFVKLDDDLVIQEHARGGTNETPEDVDFDETPARLYDVRDGSEKDLGFTVGNSEIVMHLEASGDFYVIDNLLASPDNNTPSRYRSGVLKGDSASSKLLPLRLSDDEDFTNVPILGASHGGSDQSLLTGLDHTQLLFAAKDRVGGFSLAESSAVQAAIDSCGAAVIASSQYFSESRLFKVYFADEPDLAQHLQTFGDCLSDNGAPVLLGYSYYFGTVDPVNGRITSD